MRGIRDFLSNINLTTFQKLFLHNRENLFLRNVENPIFCLLVFKQFNIKNPRSIWIMSNHFRFSRSAQIFCFSRKYWLTLRARLKRFFQILVWTLFKNCFYTIVKKSFYTMLKTQFFSLTNLMCFVCVLRWPKKLILNIYGFPGHYFKNC